MGAPSSWMPTLLLALALLSAGCCLSIGSEEIASSTGGQTSAGQASGGQASTGGSATAGECAGLTGSFVVVPNVIDFGPTLIDTTAKRSVMLQNCSTAAVTGITAIVLGEDANLFEVNNVPATLGPGDSAMVDISYSPLALETRSLGTVIFGGSDGEMSPLNLFGEPLAVVTDHAAKSHCYFGYVALDTTCRLLRRCDQLRWRDRDQSSGVGSFAEDGAFSVAATDNFPINLPGGTSANVCFGFTPTITQQYSGQATLRHRRSHGHQPGHQSHGLGRRPGRRSGARRSRPTSWPGR